MNARDDGLLVTRRGLLQWAAGLCAFSGSMPLIGSRRAATRSATRIDARSPSGALLRKIALEEHFVIPETLAASRGAAGSPDFQRRLADTGNGRIAEMDRGALDVCVLSLVADGIQSIPRTSEAIRTARLANDRLAEQIAKNPRRLKGFAALPLQDPEAAAQELTRCIKELGFCGTLVNGFSQAEGPDPILFYDLPRYRDFWATVQQLNVPFYLHPRTPLPNQPAYDGHAWLASAWALSAETAIHALRLMGSGLFDDYPKLKIVIGHLGEGLPCGIWRADNRIARTLGARPAVKQPIGHYLRQNFYITTSGNFSTHTLGEVIAEMGADRVLYSVDYPFEDVAIAAEWLDHAEISDSDRDKIGHANARQLLGI